MFGDANDYGQFELDPDTLPWMYVDNSDRNDDFVRNLFDHNADGLTDFLLYDEEANLLELWTNTGTGFVQT